MDFMGELPWPSTLTFFKGTALQGSSKKLFLSTILLLNFQFTF
jgi:hypothetical protein